MSTRTVSCPNCQKAIQVPAEAAGKKIRCKACQEVFTVPGGDDPPRATARAKPATAKPTAAKPTAAKPAAAKPAAKSRWANKPGRDFAAEAAKETDASLQAVIEKLESVIAGGGAGMGIVNGQLHAYRRERDRRKAAK
jgi:hypothetical protein